MDSTTTSHPEGDGPIPLSPGAPGRAAMLLAAVLGLAYVAAFLPVWKSLLAAWSYSEDASHGFVILPVALYIVWSRRQILARIPFRPSWLGLGLVLGFLATYLLGLLGGIDTLASLSMIGATAGGLLYLFGPEMLWECAFPLFLLLFMVPVPAQIYAYLTSPLQLFVSTAAAAAVQLLQIPVWREGNILHLPERSFQVIQACSGLRSILSLLTLSLLIAYFSLRANGPRTLLFAAGLPVAILVNIARVLLLILAFHYFGLDLTAGSSHTALGMILFALAVALILLLRRVLMLWDRSPEHG